MVIPEIERQDSPEPLTPPAPAAAAPVLGSRLHSGETRYASLPYVPSPPQYRGENGALGGDPRTPIQAPARSPQEALPLAETGKSSCRAPAGVVDAEEIPLPRIKKLEEDSIRAALERTQGRLYGPRGAAQLLGVKASTLASRMKSLGIPKD